MSLKVEAVTEDHPEQEATVVDRARALLRKHPDSTALQSLRLLYRLLTVPSLCMETNYNLFREPILELDRNNIPGDICEIGAFNGKGSAMLASMCNTNNRKIVVIEPFDACNDTSVNSSSNRSNTEEYKRLLGIWNQRLLFLLNTFRYGNKIKLYAEDSAKVHFPEDQVFAFSFIDGNHSPDYVNGDFERMFSRTSVGGYIAMHDYASEHLPEITRVIDAIKQEYSGRIEVHLVNQAYYTIIFKKVAS